MRISLSVLLLFFAIAANVNALSSVTSRTCTITFNDYTTYGICFKNSPPSPDDMKLAVLAVQADPPIDYTPQSCKGNPDDQSVAYGKVQVTVSGTGTETSICNTFECQQNSPIDTVKSWLTKYPLNSDVTCYQSDTNPAIVYFELSGFCSYTGTFSTANNTCDCQEGYTQEDCSQFVSPDYTGAASTIQYSSFVLAIIALIASAFFL